MIDEKYLQKAISIRRTYLKLINNMDLYRARALQVSERLDGTLKKIDDYQNELAENSKSKNPTLSETEIFQKLLKIIDEVDEEGKRLEKLIDPINLEIEKLSKEEMELYRQILDGHPNLTEEQIVEKVQDRLIKEGLS
jgi:predicted  nucleic acid-binding Zn-ribbon protein